MYFKKDLATAKKKQMTFFFSYPKAKKNFGVFKKVFLPFGK